MDKGLLEIQDYEDQGYKPLINYGAWRVGILRFLDGLQPERQNSMERHVQTDEVFVLTKGKGVLIMGGSGTRVDGVYPQVMEIGKIYNVKQSAWHTILLSRDASVVIVENRDTSEINTEYAHLSPELQRLIVQTARLEQL